jgi:hypothetical protein
MIGEVEEGITGFDRRRVLLSKKNSPSLTRGGVLWIREHPHSSIYTFLS